MTADQPRRIGPYEVLGLLGEGAMGQVYKAVQPSLNRLVAIKVLPAEFLADEERVERFEREAQAVALLNHPNVVQIIDKNREEDLLYFVMEYVPGTSLDAVMRQRRLSLHEVFRVAKGICRGLEAAHRQNIVHRDLNPRNVLVSEDLSVVKLADFGISRVEEISRQQGTLSTSEISLGSLHYMSPEQATNMVEADHRSDIYSFGVTLYEMLTGRVPIGRFSLPSQVNNELPSDIDPLVLKCLEVDRVDRYATVSGVLTDLERLEDRLKLGLVRELKGISQQTSKIFLKSAGTLRHRKRQSLLVVVALLALAGGAGAFFFLRGRAADGPLAARSPAPAASAGEPAAPAAAPDADLDAAPDADPAAPSAGPEAEPAAPGADPVADPAATGAATAVDQAGAADPLRGPGAPRFEAPEWPQRVAPAGPAAWLADVQPPPFEPATDDSADPDAAAAAAPEISAELARAQEDLAVVRDKLAAGLNAPALDDLERFVEEHAATPLVPQAYLLMAHALVAEGRIEQALAAYVEVGSRFGDSPQAAAAAFEHARLVEQSGGKEAAREARDLYAAAAAEHPRSRWAAPALAAQARIEEDLKMTMTHPELGARVPAAVVPWRVLTQRYPATAEAEWAFWQLGETYADLKRFELAAASFAELGRRFPATTYEAWWRAGQIYDRRLDKKAEAISAYGKVPPSSNHHDAAQKRINRLSR